MNFSPIAISSVLKRDGNNQVPSIISVENTRLDIREETDSILEKILPKTTHSHTVFAVWVFLWHSEQCGHHRHGLIKLVLLLS